MAIMVRKPPSGFSLGFTVGTVLAFVGWTLLVLFVPGLSRLDRAVDLPTVRLGSPAGQVAGAIALLSWPPLVYGGLLGLAAWAHRYRFRNLSAGAALIVVISLVADTALKYALRRPAPADALPLFTTEGLSYPSNHLSVAVSGLAAVGATLVITRRSRQTQVIWGLIASVIILVIAVDRLVLGANRLTDLVGALFLGGAVTSVALLAAGVRVLPGLVTFTRRSNPDDDEDTPPRRCAVVYNPAKILDWAAFRRQVEFELSSRGWSRAIWLETTVDDPGYRVTRYAVRQGVDLVLGAGGDGTIRSIASGLTGSGIPFGIIPAGTGNLLARNLGIPLDLAAALDVAFDGAAKPTDVVQIRVDGGPPDHFMVMAGIGLDAVIMQGTNPDLKKAVGSAAYFVSAAQHANHPAAHATIQVDDGEPFRRRAHVIVVGNVGYLQANIPLIPDAKPDDGLLDVLIASPRSVTDWIRLTGRVLTRAKRDDDQLDRLTGRKVRIEVADPDHYQLDGDTAGDGSVLEAEVLPGALLVRVPTPVRSPRPAEAAAAHLGDAVPEPLPEDGPRDQDSGAAADQQPVPAPRSS
ncbi:YegS/Rv2252/BmrU family lipid kinase [Friedmanniella endophytica]|uniref:YegS/Rv2252/BmrU family lipid kinase n=1 Tax=Microlunatus kandeliicorticis TaxID=1759536 RepID=A0A7W3IRJ0_9ACTN|nr:diacylglycerol kinase family protein [Microlunatus kandeliicorticis]MBA8793855.1 YegS/Rv2252/BmrU family lipid kinase [Microlunatus kandeliicorticis]